MSAVVLAKCPCCDRPMRVKLPVIVDLNSNTVSINGKTAALNPTHAEILTALIESYPRWATFDHILARVYGGEYPDKAADSIRVSVSHLRRKIEPLGWTIDVITVEGRWKLVPTSEVRNGNIRQAAAERANKLRRRKAS